MKTHYSSPMEITPIDKVSAKPIHESRLGFTLALIGIATAVVVCGSASAVTIIVKMILQ